MPRIVNIPSLADAPRQSYAFASGTPLDDVEKRAAQIFKCAPEDVVIYLYTGHNYQTLKPWQVIMAVKEPVCVDAT